MAAHHSRLSPSAALADHLSLFVAGHFAAWEQPELLAKEVIEFFLVDVGLGSGSPKL